MCQNTRISRIKSGGTEINHRYLKGSHGVRGLLCLSSFVMELEVSLLSIKKSFDILIVFANIGHYSLLLNRQICLRVYT